MSQHTIFFFQYPDASRPSTSNCSYFLCQDSTIPRTGPVPVPRPHGKTCRHAHGFAHMQWRGTVAGSCTASLHVLHRTFHTVCAYSPFCASTWPIQRTTLFPTGCLSVPHRASPPSECCRDRALECITRGLCIAEEDVCVLVVKHCASKVSGYEMVYWWDPASQCPHALLRLAVWVSLGHAWVVDASVRDRAH